MKSGDLQRCKRYIFTVNALPNQTRVLESELDNLSQHTGMLGTRSDMVKYTNRNSPTSGHIPCLKRAQPLNVSILQIIRGFGHPFWGFPHRQKPPGGGKNHGENHGL